MIPRLLHPQATDRIAKLGLRRPANTLKEQQLSETRKPLVIGVGVSKNWYAHREAKPLDENDFRCELLFDMAARWNALAFNAMKSPRKR